MKARSGSRWGICALVAVCALSAAPTAQARDFFQALFGAFSDNPSLAPARPEPVQPESSSRLPFAHEGEMVGRPAQPGAHISDEGGSGGGGSQAFCVRACDGRYFPISTGANQSSA